MSNFNPKICREGIDFARGFAFLLTTRHETDPWPTQNLYRVMLQSATFGGMILYEDEQGEVVGAVCYSIGTEQAEFKDRYIVHVNYILLKPALQGTYYFLKCAEFFLNTMSIHHSEVSIIMMEAEESAQRNNRLYAKFARLTKTVSGDSSSGRLHVYQTTLAELLAYTQKLLNRSKGPASQGISIERR